jgi:hypothetical protein
MVNPTGESTGVHEARFRPPPKASISRLCDHRRCGTAGISGTGRSGRRLTDMAGDVLGGARTGGNGRYALVGLLRQSVFGRPAGYEDVNDADRLAHDRAMRAVVDRSGLDLPDGPLRDRTADMRGQPRGTDRSVPVRGSTGCTRVSRRTPSYSTWTAARVKPMARRRVTEVMVPRDLFADILALIAQLRAHPHQHEEFENDVRERTTGRGVSR